MRRLAVGIVSVALLAVAAGSARVSASRVEDLENRVARLEEERGDLQAMAAELEEFEEAVEDAMAAESEELEEAVEVVLERFEEDVEEAYDALEEDVEAAYDAFWRRKSSGWKAQRAVTTRISSRFRRQ